MGISHILIRVLEKGGHCSCLRPEKLKDSVESLGKLHPQEHRPLRV